MDEITGVIYETQTSDFKPITVELNIETLNQLKILFAITSLDTEEIDSVLGKCDLQKTLAIDIMGIYYPFSEINSDIGEVLQQYKIGVDI